MEGHMEEIKKNYWNRNNEKWEEMKVETASNERWRKQDIFQHKGNSVSSAENEFWSGDERHKYMSPSALSNKDGY